MKKIFNPLTERSYPVREHSSKYDPEKRIPSLWKHNRDDACKATRCNLNLSGYCEAPNWIDDFDPANCSKKLTDCVSNDGEHIGLPEEVIKEWLVDE